MANYYRVTAGPVKVTLGNGDTHTFATNDQVDPTGEFYAPLAAIPNMLVDSGTPVPPPSFTPPPPTVKMVDVTSSATAPASPSTDDLWFDTNTGQKILKRWNGTAWESNSAAYVGVSGRIADLPSVPYVAHRGGAYTAPENTIEAIDAALAQGAKIIKLDAILTADNGLVLMHDSTLDRTTTLTGNVSGYSVSGLRQGKIDAQTWFGGTVYTDLAIPTLPDALRRIGNRATLIIEPKSQASVQPVLDMLTANGISKASAIIEVFTLSWGAPAVSAGWRVLFTDDGTAAATVLAAGVTDIAVNYQVDSGRIAGYVSAGLRVWAYNILRRKDSAAAIALGATAILSDDWLYTSATIDGLTSDPFVNQTFYHGHIETTLGDGRGTFSNSNMWGYPTNGGGSWKGAIAGWAAPKAGKHLPGTYTITGKVFIDSASDATRFASIVFACMDDEEYRGNSTKATNGYHAFIRQNGELWLYRYDNGTGTAISSKTTGITAVAAGGSATVSIAVTPTQITFSRTDVAYACPIVTDSAYRGDYMHLGGQSAAFRWQTVTVPASA